jgi:excisionase family DNA binding protein
MSGLTIPLTLSEETVEALARAIADAMAAQAPAAPEPYMTTPELAKHLRVSENHVRNLVSSNEIPHKRIGKAVRFRASEVDAWLDGRK